MRKVYKTGIKKKSEKIVLFGNLTGDEMPLNNLPNILFSGNSEVKIEGFKCITEYTDTCIVINLGKSRISFSGSNLTVNLITDEELIINGNITKVEFC